MIRKCLFSASLALAVLPGISMAQMYKCIGPNGEVTFTKHGCATDNETTKIEVGSVNTQDSREARQNMADQQYRRSMQPNKTRVTVVADSGATDRKQRELCRAATTPHKGAQNGQLTAAQRAAAASACSGRNSTYNYDAGATESYGSAAPSYTPPPPTHITDCDQTGCWDNQGGRYNKGAGPTHIRNDGRVCQSVGGQMICN